MYRGTTPTITINCDIDVSEFVTMWVTFRTQQLATYAPPKQVEVTKHLGDEGVDAADNALKVKVDALWDFVCTDITSNPFQITFDDLDGLTVRSGIWNTGQRRLEC